MMDIQVWKEGDHLCLRYAVTNDTGESLYLYNQVKDWFGLTNDPELSFASNKNARGTPELAHVYDQGGGLALFFQGRPPEPLGVELVVPRVPLASRVAPGETFRATIRAALPLQEWDAYQPPRAAPSEPVRIRRVRLQVQYVREKAVWTVREHVNFLGGFVVNGPLELFEASADLAEPVDLLRRTDSFQRLESAGVTSRMR